MNQIAKTIGVADEAESLAEWTEDLLEWARIRLQDADQRARKLAQEHPMLALVGAAAVGCAAGRVLSRI